MNTNRQAKRSLSINIVNIIKKIVNSAANLVKCVMPERVHCKAFLV